MKNFINKIRIFIVKKLLNKNDGYIYIGTCENEDIGFYYDNSIDRYVLGKRSNNYYYEYIGLNGWISYRSRYLGEKNIEIKEIPFQNWIYGIAEDIHKDYMKTVREKEV